jgi:hypothetical protein
MPWFTDGEIDRPELGIGRLAGKELPELFERIGLKQIEPGIHDGLRASES